MAEKQLKNFKKPNNKVRFEAYYITGPVEAGVQGARLNRQYFAPAVCIDQAMYVQKILELHSNLHTQTLKTSCSTEIR